MRIGIIGTSLKKFYNKEQVHFFQDHVTKYVNRLPNHCHIVTGCADGVDEWAREAGKKRLGEAQVHVHVADWSIGKKAGPIRTKKVINDSDLVVAFWNGTSKGTKNGLEFCDELRVPWALLTPDIDNDGDRIWNYQSPELEMYDIYLIQPEDMYAKTKGVEQAGTVDWVYKVSKRQVYRQAQKIVKAQSI